MTRLTLSNRAEVLPALHRRSVAPVAKAPAAEWKAPAAENRMRFEQRTTRMRRFPVEESLARSVPEGCWRGRYLDIEV